jgi:aryl-alcohol dehydrogenase-like predicted oxidoreductase
MKYVTFGKSGLRVSELALGTMTFGEEWGYGANKVESQRIFEDFLNHGGNFIDTANRYTEGSSEKFLGKFIKDSGKRNELVVATKFGLSTQMGLVNDSGNHRKNLVQSLEGSLQRLQTDFVDVLYLHAWDFTTPAEEVLRALDDLISQGKVLHIAVSDTPAWIISRSLAISEFKNWSAFVGMQTHYNLLKRDAERDLIPMANSLGLTTTAWAPIAGGALSGKYLDKTQNSYRLKPESKRLAPTTIPIVQAVQDIASELNCLPVHVALNWIRQKGIIPVIGCRSLAQMIDNLHCLDYELTPEHFTTLNTISEIDLGFPHDFVREEGVQQIMYGGMIDRIEFPMRC